MAARYLLRKHLLNARKGPKMVTFRASQDLHECLKQSQFRCSPKLQQALAALDGNDMEGRKAYCLDTEFSSAKHLIYEVTFIDATNDHVVIDTLLDGDCKIPDRVQRQANERSTSSIDVGPSFRSGLGRVWDSKHSSKVYGKYGPINAASPSMLAKMIKESGITKHDFIFEWTRREMDLPQLRGMLDTAGYHDLLPPNENCIPMIPEWRNNLPNCFSLAMDVFFPMAFPQDPLVGHNHRSKPDTQMLLKLVKLFRQLLKPGNERDMTGIHLETVDRFLAAAAAEAPAKSSPKRKSTFPVSRSLKWLAPKSSLVQSTIEWGRLEAIFDEAAQADPPTDRTLEDDAQSQQM
jgi:hypothetical protein